jgi:hypothetical protein
MFIIGLDLGQAQDFTALAIVESEGQGNEQTFAVRHLHRFPLGTAYTAMVPLIAEMCQRIELRNAPLVVDQTGVGRAVVDLIRQARIPGGLRPVTITAGQMAHRTDTGWNVPKKEFVGTLQVLLQSRRLTIAPAMPLAPLLASELQHFRVRVTAAANETFNAREGQHDDLVLATALACWEARRMPQWEPGDILFGGGFTATSEGASPTGQHGAAEEMGWSHGYR